MLNCSANRLNDNRAYAIKPACGINNNIRAYGLSSADNHLIDTSANGTIAGSHYRPLLGLDNCKTENNNYINMNNASETWGENNRDVCYSHHQNPGYRRSQCNTNEKMITITENKNYYNEDTLNIEYGFQGKGDSCNMHDELSYVNERNESCNVNSNSLKPVKTKSQGDQNQTNETFNKTIKNSSAAEKYLDVGEDRNAKQSYCLERMAFSTFVRGVFVWKYHTNKDQAHAFLRSVDCLTGADIDTLLKGQRKSNCTRCQYYCFLTCLTLTGAMMPPTPSPFSSPNNFNTKLQKSKSPMYPTKITEQQYHDLYGDFKIANDGKNYQSQREDIVPNKMVDLSFLVEEEMRKTIHTFTSEVFTTLVEEYLKLFEEMVKGLILLKETGITLEDICSIGEENHAHYCQKAIRTSDKDSIVSFSEPYNAIEFEELLLEQVKQFRSKEDAKSAYVQAHEPNQNPISSKERLICDCRIGEKENPYFYFLSHINSNDLPSSNTEEFDQILRTEKQMFLKSCLELLRDNDYFRIHGQSSLESVDEAKFNTAKGGSGTQDIVEEEMYKMSVSIYNKTVCHVQSSIFAIFRSMKQSTGSHRLLPPTPKTTHSDRNIGGNECTDQIKNALSDYLRGTDQSASSEDEVFIRKDNFQDNLILEQSDKCLPTQPQTISSVRYENEITHRDGHYNDRQIQYEPNKIHCLRNEKETRPRQEEIMQKHPNLDYTDSSRQYKERERNHPIENSQGHTAGTNLPYFTQNTAQTNLALQKRQETTVTGFQPHVQTIENKTVIIPPSPREIEACFFNKSLFRRKKKDASVVCVLNYHNPEVSHMDVIAFLNKMEAEGGVLHYPYCSENNLLTKMESPSFYLSVCCSDCQLELAPAEKLEAFKSETNNLHRSKLVSHIIGKNRAPFYFPVRCGSCNHFLCETQKGKKLFVPFHSATKGYICASRLRSHTCEPNSSEKEYTGCPSDILNNSSQVLKKINEDVSESHKTNITSNRTRITRSRSLPVLCPKDLDYRDVMKNEKGPTRMNTPLKFEEAVSNILHIWTYDMIDYEKGANTPHLRSQILNYRKSLSIFIKKDIREKLYYRHILSVFKRVEDYESPILDFQKNLSSQKGVLDYKIMKKSRSCHSKLSYEASSATRRSKVESLEYNHNTAALNARQSQDPGNVVNSSYLRPGTMNRNNLTRPLSFHSELKQKSPAEQRRRSYSFTESAYKKDISIQMNAWKNELQELQKSIESPDLRFETMNRRNIVRPVSLHSELKQKSVAIPHRRRSSCSFAGESRYEDYSTQITVWKNELLKLQKSVESPNLGTDATNRYNTKRPLSLHCEINNKPAAQRRRSCSFTDTECKDLPTNIDAWKKELQNLQKSVESPNMRFGAINRIHYTKANSLRTEPERTATSTQRPKSESFINQFSAQINKSKVELLRLQKSFETLRMRTASMQHKRHTGNIVHNSVIQNAALAPSQRQSESVINKQYSSELNAWRNELLKLQKSAESPNLLSKARDRNINIRTGSLDSESKRTSAAPPLKSVLEDSLTELKTWNHKLRELERDATSPHWQTGKFNRRIKIRAHSLHAEPKRSNLHENRPKSESVLDDFSTELESWKHELLTLEEDAKNPQTEQQQRKNIAMPRSLHSQPTTAHKVNFETMDNNGDPSTKNVEKSQVKIKQSNTANIASSQKSPARRYSSTPRQLPTIPDHKSRRHSHYETTGNFVNLLSDRRATRLNTHARNTTTTSSNYEWTFKT